MEIIIIIIIIFVVMMVIGGGDIIPQPTSAEVAAKIQLAKSQWRCEEVVWKTASMVNDHFKGNMELRCDVEGLSGGGIQELRKHMLSKLPKQAKTIHSGPNVENYEGLPSVHYDISMKTNAEDESVVTRGNLHIATNGFTHLRNVFTATQLPTSGKARYLKAMMTEINVESTDRPGWYRVRMVNANSIERPWLVSTDTFRKTIVNKTEEKYGEKAESILTDLANHL